MTGKGARVSIEIILDSLANIRAMKTRNLLALVGVAIGTAAVIAMLHVGHNAQIEAVRQFEEMGTSLINVLPGSKSDGFDALSTEDVLKLPDVEGLGVEAAAAIIRVGTSIRLNGAEISATGLAVSDGFYSIAGTSLQLGRKTFQLDGYSPYIVLGASIADHMTAVMGRPVQVGDRLEIRGHVLSVVGVLAPIVPNMILGIDLNNSVLTAVKGARRLGGQPSISAIAGRLSEGVDDLAAASAVAAFLGKGVNVQTARQLIAGVEQQMRIYGLLLLAIGAVSLVVGGVGIMNVMLMNVLERRQEIGLRQALGARRRDIRLMFLVEALVVSNAGSVVGVASGFGAAWVFANASGWEFFPSPLAIPMGVGMAFIVGLFFGSYPAIRAANLNPVDALRGQ